MCTKKKGNQGEWGVTKVKSLGLAMVEVSHGGRDIVNLQYEKPAHILHLKYSTSSNMVKG